MSENKHTAEELKQWQSLPLDVKISMSRYRIREWYKAWDGDVYVSFSGGKDSTVLKHLVETTLGKHYNPETDQEEDVPSVFVNTGLEYPEIQKFVRDCKAGKYENMGTNIEIIRPEMRFDEVIKKYGYPVGTKRVSHYVDIARRKPDSICRKYITGEAWTLTVTAKKWESLLDAPFLVSDKCCNIMKKKPIFAYQKQTERKPYVGTMASEGKQREISWINNGCNAFDIKKPQSRPLAFWTEQDILQYILKYNLPYASVYGDIVPDNGNDEALKNQMTIFEALEDYEGAKLKTTGCNRTGCMFCMFGCHLEKEPNRFQMMKETHPNQYAYCMKSVEEGGLGLKEVLEYINVPYE